MWTFDVRRRALAAAIVLFGAGLAPACAGAAELVITIKHLKALDALDAFSKGDFYARVTIDGKAQTTPTAKQQSEIRPNWKITETVTRGKHDVKVEVFDKDVSVNDPIDINAVSGKRDIDFTVNTRPTPCRIEGFRNTFRCPARITRSGTENKKAEITFTVDVRGR